MLHSPISGTHYSLSVYAFPFKKIVRIRQILSFLCLDFVTWHDVGHEMFLLKEKGQTVI